MRTFDGIGLAKAVLWEEAKGKLRALVAADGAAVTPVRELVGGKFHFEIIEEVIEEFITKFEDDGHHE